MTIAVAVAGATGKLGSAVVQAVEGADDLEIVARLDSTSDLSLTDGADVVVDATLPDVSETIVDYAVTHGADVVVGTSGWSDDRIRHWESRMATLPERGLTIVPNFSVGSALATAFATVAARFYDSIEIVEAHRSSKIDSPSGTAVRTAELLADARGDRGPVNAPHNDQRARGQRVSSVPVHSLRLDGVVARQETIFGGPGETLTLRHDTVDTSAYRAGILLAVRSAPGSTGVRVGLDALLELGMPRPAHEAE